MIINNSFKEKEYIAQVCENLYKECLREIPQFENEELIWILNGSTLCNILYNVVKIDSVEVSGKFTQHCYDFIRKPKGDIDITYKADRPYKFDLENKFIKEYQIISEEQRTYNFVDSNSELSEDDFEELCTLETKSGLSFIAKKPQYLFLYKFREFLVLFNNEILNNDLDLIKKKKKNIIDDITNLYNIAIDYCGKEELNRMLTKLPKISSYLNKFYNENNNKYYELINVSLKMIESIINKNSSKKSI